MAIRMVPATELVQDFNLYPRAQIDDYHVREMANAMQAGVEFPAIIAERSTKRITDGFHRVRAWQRDGGPNVKVPVEFHVYENEAALFTEAIRLNSAHGRNLTIYDKTRCLTLAEEYGIERSVAADALHITVERAEKLLVERVAATGEVLKRTMHHLAGKSVTAAQRAFNRDRAGGLDQLFYINQVIALLETDSMDWSRDNVVAGLRRLHEMLGAKMVSASAA